MGFYDGNPGHPTNKKWSFKKYLFLGIGIAFTLFVFYVLGMIIIYED